MKRLNHDVNLREKITDEDGLIFFEGTLKVPQNTPIVEAADLGGDWYIEHEVSLGSPTAAEGTWVPILKQPMSMDIALNVLCALAEHAIIMVEDDTFLSLPADFYTMLGEGYDENRQYFSRRYATDTRFRMRNETTNELIEGDVL